MKKFTAFLLVLVMVLSILPTAAFAANPASDFEYENYGRRVTIKRYIGNKFEVVIPDTIEGKLVVTIDREAFKNNRGIFSVKIPKYLREIGDDAFAGCYNLQLVVFMGKFVQKFGNNVFSRVNAAQLIIPIDDDNLFPQVGKKVRWLGGTFDVIDMYDHKCQDGVYSQDKKCDICGRVMNGSNLNLGRNFRNPVVPAAKAAVRTAAAVGTAAVKTAAAVGTAVAVTAAKAVKTTAIVVRSILKWF